MLGDARQEMALADAGFARHEQDIRRLPACCRCHDPPDDGMLGSAADDVGGGGRRVGRRRSVWRALDRLDGNKRVRDGLHGVPGLLQRFSGPDPELRLEDAACVLVVAERLAFPPDA
jgi:hypothetical protein